VGAPPDSIDGRVATALAALASPQDQRARAHGPAGRDAGERASNQPAFGWRDLPCALVMIVLFEDWRNRLPMTRNPVGSKNLALCRKILGGLYSPRKFNPLVLVEIENLHSQKLASRPIHSD
jgi:hypothetical protein